MGEESVERETLGLLHHLIERVAKSAPDKPFLHFKGETLSYGQVAETSQRLARALNAVGIIPGDRVALMLSNRPELVIAYFACWKLGATAVPLNTRYQRREAAHALEHSGAEAFICETRFFPIVEPLCRRDNLHDHTILVDGRDNGVVEFPDYGDFLAGAPEEINWPDVTPDTPTNINYTSGSTAMPKGVLHSHHTLLEMVKVLDSYMWRPELGTSIAFLPICYIGAFLIQLLNSAYRERDLVIIHQKSIDDFLDAVGRYGATDTCLLPTDLINVLEHPKAAETDWSSLLWIGAGGDKVPVDAQHEFKRIAGLEVTELYGMTEIGLVMGNPSYGDKHLGTMGQAFPAIGAEVRDEAGDAVAVGKEGDLWIKTPSMMLEYWNNPQATAETIRDGWLDTGDIVIRDEEGYFHFVGRSKLIIVHGGSNVSPQEVEEIIDHHPAVMSCCVVGVADARLGETVLAYVVVP